MAWSGTYSTKIVKKLNDLSNAKYDPVYDKQINSTANQISNYGPYTSRYQPDIDNITGQINNYGTYNSKYQPYIDDYSNRIANWDYDPESDKSYQAYKQQYTTAGQKAMRDTLGQVSARTGGLASSYAGSAAQQTYDGYMQQLASMIPQLEQNAYNRATNTLNMYQGLDQTDYGRWRDALTDLYNRGNYLNGLDQTEYGRWADRLQDLYNQNGMYLNMDSNLYNRFLGNQQMGYDQLSAMQDYNDWEYQMWQDELARAAAAAKGSGGGGRGGGGRGRGGSGGSGSSSSNSGQAVTPTAGAAAGAATAALNKAYLNPTTLMNPYLNNTYTYATPAQTRAMALEAGGSPVNALKKLLNKK